MYSSPNNSNDGQNMPHFRGVEILESPAMHNTVLNCEGIIDYHSVISGSCKKTRGRPKKPDGNLSPKRPRGRPRIHPPKDPNAPRRPRGRPRKSGMNNSYDSGNQAYAPDNEPKFDNMPRYNPDIEDMHQQSGSSAYMGRSSWHQILSGDLCEWRNNLETDHCLLDKECLITAPNNSGYLQLQPHNHNATLFCPSKNLEIGLANTDDISCDNDGQHMEDPPDIKKGNLSYLDQDLGTDVMNYMDNGDMSNIGALGGNNAMYGMGWQNKYSSLPINAAPPCQLKLPNNSNDYSVNSIEPKLPAKSNDYLPAICYNNAMGPISNIEREELSIDILQDLLELRRIK